MNYLIPPVEDGIYKKWSEGHIYQGFGESKELYRNALSSANYDFIGGHNGIDIAPPRNPSKRKNYIVGTEGTVVDVKDTPNGYGKHVRILTDVDTEGNQLEITYGHLSEIFVPLGYRVKDHEVIAQMGNSGFIVSGGVPYWGNAPAGKGVHLHCTIRECSAFGGKWQTVYPNGLSTFVKNYDNGTRGAVDPIPYLRFESTEGLLARLLAMLKLTNKLYFEFTKLKGRNST